MSTHRQDSCRRWSSPHRSLGSSDKSSKVRRASGRGSQFVPELVHGLLMVNGELTPIPPFLL